MISTSSNKTDEIVAPDEIETYVSMPSCLLQGCSNNLIIFRADGGNHFTHYGIYEGMFLRCQQRFQGRTPFLLSEQFRR